MARTRDNRAVYARRKARLAAEGSTVYEVRAQRARALGYDNVRQMTYWRNRLTDDYVRQLAEEIGGPVEADRPGSLMSRDANAIVNPPGGDRSGDWRVRLLRAAGRI